MKQTFIPLCLLKASIHFFTSKANKHFNLLLALGLLLFATVNTSFTKEDPFKSTKAVLKRGIPLEGSFTATLSDLVIGQGHASYIGKFNLVAQDDESNFPTITGNVTLTAVNGDQLFITHTGEAEIVGDGQVQITFESTITGGSGRFTGSSGSFTMIANANDNTGTAYGTISGTIYR